MTALQRTVDYPKPPAHVAPYVEALGPALTVRFLLRFGGAAIYLPDDPKGRSEAEAFLGREPFVALSRCLGRGNVEVPTANRWLVPALAAEGMTVHEIARRVRLNRRSVMQWMANAKARAAEGKAP